MTYIANAAICAEATIKGTERRDASSTESSQFGIDAVSGVSVEQECTTWSQNTEAVTIVYPIMRAYQGYFNRVPDSSGLDYWVQVFRDNAANYYGGVFSTDCLVATTQSWSTSSEFIAKYGSLSNSDYVTQLYVNLYARQPDQSGHDYWTNQLDTGAQSRAQVMVAFTEADEYKTRANGAIQTFLYNAAACNNGLPGAVNPYTNAPLI